MMLETWKNWDVYYFRRFIQHYIEHYSGISEETAKICCGVENLRHVQDCTILMETIFTFTDDYGQISYLPWLRKLESFYQEYISSLLVGDNELFQVTSI